MNTTIGHWVLDPRARPRVAVCGFKAWGLRRNGPDDGYTKHITARWINDLTCPRCLVRHEEIGPLFDLKNTEL